MREAENKSASALAEHEKSRVAGISLVAALFLTSMKLIIGLWTNSLGILSEAAHSGLDLVAAAITFWAISVSGRPADPEHTYGHGKFENISALAETLLLLLTCVWIFWESAQRLLGHGNIEVRINAWAFAVVGVSILIDLSRSTALARVARKYKSQALEADALHFSTDVWSSAVVMLGLVGVWAAGRFGAPWLIKADAAAALGVGLIVVGVSLRLGKKSVDDLLDTVPRDMPEKIRRAAKIPGVSGVGKVRVRRSGPEFFAEVTISVDSAASVERAHHIADEAEGAVREVLPGADVIVHVEPREAAGEDLPAAVRRIASRQGLDAHDITVFSGEGATAVELHLEVSSALSVEEAHALVTSFEKELQEARPECARVVTHIEPAGGVCGCPADDPAAGERVRRVLEECLHEQHFPCHPHELEIQNLNGEINISFHCAVRANTNIAEAHVLTEKLESHLRSRLPEVGRVFIHVEPEEEAGALRETEPRP